MKIFSDLLLVNNFPEDITPTRPVATAMYRFQYPFIADALSIANPKMSFASIAMIAPKMAKRLNLAAGAAFRTGPVKC